MFFRDDICYCADYKDCTWVKKCFRNPRKYERMPDYYSMSNFKGTQYCPKERAGRKKEVTHDDE